MNAPSSGSRTAESNGSSDSNQRQAHPRWIDGPIPNLGRVLNALVGATAASQALLLGVALSDPVRAPRLYAIVVVALTVCSIAFGVSRRYGPVAASWTFQTLVFVVIVAASWTGGGLRSPAYLASFPFMMASGILLGWRVGLVSVALCLANGLALAAAQLSGWLPHTVPEYGPLAFWILSGYSAIALIAQMHMALRTIDESRVEAESEHEARTQAQGALEASEQKFRTYCELALDGLAITGPDGTWIDANDRLCSILGFPREQLHSLRWRDLVHPEDRTLFESSLQGVLDGRQGGFSLDLRMVARDGGLLYVTFSTNALRSPDGSIDRWVTLVHDRTERTLADQALHESRRRFEDYVRHSPYGLIIVDNRARYVEANPATERITGYSFDELIGKNVMDSLDPSMLEAAHDHFMRVGKEGSAYGEFLMARKDGALRWVSVNAVRLTDEQFIGFIDDVTDRRRAQEDLRASEEYQRSIVANAPFGCHFYHVSPQDELIFDGANPAADRILGVDHQRFVGKKILEAFPALEGTEVPDTYLRLANEGGYYEREDLHYSEGGIVGAFNINAFNTGKRRMAVFFNDITRQKQADQEIRRLAETLEERVQERTEQLQAAVKDLESFTYSVSHDLRAPLRAIDGFAAILSEDYGESLDDEGQRLLGVVRGEAQRMGRLIDDLLQFSRLGRQPLQMAGSNMNAIVAEVVSTHAAEIAERRIAVSVEPLPNAKADPSLMRQVWANLFDNAVKYTRHTSEPRISIDGHVEGQQAVYRIRDNGAGFNMEHADQLFGVFHRLHRHDEFEGTGVGLAIVHRIVERHGGRVWAESEEGKGALFCFSLPNVDP